MSRAHLSAVALVAALGSVRAEAYNFLCNDYTGSGDFCGAVCNENTAARWEPAQVEFHFDRQNIDASGLTATEWNNVIADCIDAWNSAGAGSLDVVDGNTNPSRTFAGNAAEQAVFWSTSGNDWSNQTGIGANDGVLAVTSAPYGCIGNTDRGPLEDADILMNNVMLAGETTSGVLETLTHEMGHGLGLDHPCEACSRLMSATIFGVVGPQSDDIAGIQALYDIPAGAVGSPCAADGTCDSGLCVAFDGGGFCSQACGTCPGGMVCADLPGEGNVCVFNGAGIAEPGETCGPPACVDECVTGIDPGCNLCLPVTETASECWRHLGFSRRDARSRLCRRRVLRRF
jgi:hypothetical protein